MNRESDEGQPEFVREEGRGGQDRSAGEKRVGSPAETLGNGAPVNMDLPLTDGWSREDFVAALPLYVGGELDRTDANRVDAWLAAHPEDQETLAASEAAAGVLARHAIVQRERSTPDLWSGIRSELETSGLIEAASGQRGAARGQLLVEPSETPILGGPRWFQRKSVAAAAALLLMGSVGAVLMSRGAGWMDAGSPAGSPAGLPSGLAEASAIAATAPESAASADSFTRPRSAAPALESTAGESIPGGSGAGRPGALGAGNALVAGASAEGPRTAVAGTSERPIDVIAVDHRSGARRRRAGAEGRVAAGKTQRLRLPKPGEGRLIDEAPNVLLWQVSPLRQPAALVRRGTGDAQLTGH